MSAAKEMPAIRVTWCAITDVGRVRSQNEDAFVGRDLDGGRSFESNGARESLDLGARGLVLAVSDGMGGAQAGEVASALVLKTLQENLAKSDESGDEALRIAVENANRAVYEASKEPSHRGMGATLTALLLHGSAAYIASVGDSRAYVQRGSRFRQMTRDQSYVQVLVDAGVLDSAEAERSPMKNIVLQSMGQQNDVQVALGKLELFRGDRLVVCSDGLTGHVKDREIQAELERRDTSLEAIARRLVDIALERGGEDNITVLVAEVSGNGLSRAELPESVTQTYQVISEFEAGIGPSDRKSDPASRSSSVPPPAADSEKRAVAISSSVRPGAPAAPGRVPGSVIVVALVVGVLAIGILLVLLRLTLGA